MVLCYYSVYSRWVKSVLSILHKQRIVQRWYNKSKGIKDAPKFAYYFYISTLHFIQSQCCNTVEAIAHHASIGNHLYTNLLSDVIFWGHHLTLHSSIHKSLTVTMNEYGVYSIQAYIHHSREYISPACKYFNQH